MALLWRLALLLPVLAGLVMSACADPRCIPHRTQYGPFSVIDCKGCCTDDNQCVEDGLSNVNACGRAHPDSTGAFPARVCTACPRGLSCVAGVCIELRCVPIDDRNLGGAGGAGGGSGGGLGTGGGIGQQPACTDGGVWAAVEMVSDAGPAWKAVVRNTSPCLGGLGAAVAASGDGKTVAVGARSGITPVGDGVVHVLREADGGWEVEAALRAADGPGAALGLTVALSGDGNTLAAGGMLWMNGQGAVWVFERTAAGWSTPQRLVAPQGTRDDWLGGRVWNLSDVASFPVVTLALSADGQTLAAGAPQEGPDGTGESVVPGAVYVFRRTGSAWSLESRLKPERAEAKFFGTAVALSADGQTLAVGTPDDETGRPAAPDQGPGGIRSGAVDVFRREGATWKQEGFLKASNAAASAQLGFSLALSADGERLVVGAPGESTWGAGAACWGFNGGASGSGAVYVFGRSAGTWSEEVMLKPLASRAYDGFGVALALSADGETLAAATTRSLLGGNSAARVHFFRLEPGWPQGETRHPRATSPGAFGRALSMSARGEVLVLGEPGHGFGGSGAAWVTSGPD